MFDRSLVVAKSSTGCGEGRRFRMLRPSELRFFGVVGVSAVVGSCSTSLLTGEGFGETLLITFFMKLMFRGSNEDVLWLLSDRLFLGVVSLPVDGVLVSE